MKSKHIFITILVFIFVSVFASSAANGLALVISSPPDNYFTNESIVAITGEADPDATLSLNGLFLENNKGVFSENITLIEGMNRIFVTAQKDGIISTEAVNVTLDTISPTVTITSPDKEYINKTILNVSYNSQDTDIVYYRVSLNKTEWVITNETYYLFNATDGMALIGIQAIDRAGNIGEAELNLTIDTIPPFIEIIKPGINEPVISRNIEMSGRTTIGAIITVNGLNITNNNGTWSKVISLSGVNNLFKIESTDLSWNTAVKIINIRLGENFTNKMPISFQEFSNISINFSKIGTFDEENDVVSGKYVSYLFDNSTSSLMAYSINNSESTTVWFNKIYISNFIAENKSIQGSIAEYSQKEKFGRVHNIRYEIHDNKMGTMLIDTREIYDIFSGIREYLLNRKPERLRICVTAEKNVTLEAKETGTSRYFVGEGWKVWPDITFELPDDVVVTNLNNGLKLQKGNEEAFLIGARFAGGSVNFTYDGNKIIAKANNSLLIFRQYAIYDFIDENIYDMLITEGISNGTIGSEVFIDSAYSYDATTFEDMSVVASFPDIDTMDINVSSKSINGTVVVVNIGGSLYNTFLEKNLIMKYDGEDIYPANSYEDIIDLTNDFGNSEYFLAVGSTGAYIFVSVPDFSSHIISFDFEPGLGSYGSRIFGLLDLLTSGLFMALPAGSRELVFSLWWFGSVMMIYLLFRKALRKKI